ncbi:hypothetical protein MKZ24_12810 [Paenibacillus sp. FSL R7-0297]|uniref:hypothetical protein n=1 Tax=unclassified Paenibacillus TaxID=185978 RepID=UPI0004F72032|nr:hypothetical protein [Paenibacillus sp. FSL R5-0912]AIQ43079.1 hypothetical protein R50912_25880 [Paenibacillus sp. FSL R5-0912]
MDTVILWVGLALLVALLTFLNQKQVYSSKVKKAYRELRELTAKVRTGQSEAADLEAWETSLAEMEKHPNEFNKLENEIGLRRAFVQYLERHYPQDARLPDLQEAAAYHKDSVWGIKIGDYGPRK